MSDLSVIPTPPRQRLRRFRIYYLPTLVFVCNVLGIFVVWRAYVIPPALVGQAAPLVTNVTAASPGVFTNLYVQRSPESHPGGFVKQRHRLRPELGEISVSEP